MVHVGASSPSSLVNATAMARAAMSRLELMPKAADDILSDSVPRVASEFIEGSAEVRVGTFRSAVSRGVHHLAQNDISYTLFHTEASEDLEPWCVFVTVFLLLILLDNMVLSRQVSEISLKQAGYYVLFWVIMAMCFCSWVLCFFGPPQAYMWISGYMLEWLLSFDNLFVFHLIFSVYGTPEHLRQRPLFIGICVAMVLRLGFLFVGEYLMRSMVLFHVVFGSFLVYTGVRTITADEEDSDPSQNVVVKWLQAVIPFVCVYDQSGAFFVRVPVMQDGELALSREDRELMTKPKCSLDSKELSYGSMDFQHVADKAFSNGCSSTQPLKWQVRATMLFLVVVCLEVSDIIFAVDSVSAMSAQVNDLFLAFTSAAFAMLGLRATFFIIDVLVHMFSLLKYGVACVLMFIGLKLCISHVYTIHPAVVCCVILGAISLSILASVMHEQFVLKASGLEFEDVEQRLDKVKEKTLTR